MNRERIERAIRILGKVKPRKFDLGSWAEFRVAELKAFEAGKRKLILNGCGTTGCAMGWIASDRTCRSEGLRLGTDSWGQATPEYWLSTGYAAVQAFFGFSDGITVDYLFSSAYYDDRDMKNPKAVVARLETLLAAGEPLFNVMCRDRGE